MRRYCRYGISDRNREQMMADHGKLKQLIRLVWGFKTLTTADATIKGREVMRRSAKASCPASPSPVPLFKTA
ncbi:Transposase and inactivated derivatives-like protein [Azospirillum melinis]